MSKWRLYLLAVLLLLPVLFLMSMGSVYLYSTKIWGVSAWLVLWWPSFLSLSAAFILALWWQRKNRLLPAPNWKPELHWTQRDREAWQLVEQRAKGVSTLDPDQLLEVQFYFDTARDLAMDLARFYHPKSNDPFGPLTIPEILAVAQLAAEDLTELVDEYVPGGHLLRIDHWRAASRLSDWYSHATTAYWLVSALYSPINTSARYLASKAGTSRPLEMLGENLKAWFYTAFVHRVGHYLIELNSGRLRVGAKRYRELLEEHGLRAPVGDARSSATPSGDRGLPVPAPTPREVTLTILGRVKAGKSSLINALLGERRAATDVIPLTNTITRYELNFNTPSADGTAESDAGAPRQTRLVLLDTVGYSHEGARADQLQATIDAVLQSDIALFALHARDPGRQPDVEVIQKLTAWFRDRPQYRLPPMLGVLTHIDLLSPMMEWSPPYDYLQPRRPKEQSIHDAVAVAREQFGSALVDFIPICAAEGKVHGVQEWLLPRIVTLLGEARAVSLLRCLHAEIDEHRIRRIFEQLLAAGKQLYRLAKQ